MRKLLSLVGVLGCVIASVVGCAKPALDPKVAAELRQKYVLGDEPADATGVVELKEAYKEPLDVVLVGQIGGVDNPWTKGQASFVITDPSALAVEEEPAAGDKTKSAAHAAHHSAPGHDPATCPFCSKKFDPAAALALVKFNNAEGGVLSVDAQELFQLKKDQLVVVRGRAEQDPAGYLVVTAQGIYVRR